MSAAKKKTGALSPKQSALVIDRMAAALFAIDEREHDNPRAWAAGSVCEDERDDYRVLARAAYAASQGEDVAIPPKAPPVLSLSAVVLALLTSPPSYELLLADGTTCPLPPTEFLAARFLDNAMGRDRVESGRA